MGERINRAIITQLGTLRCGDAWKNNKYNVARNIMMPAFSFYKTFLIVLQLICQIFLISC
jgi:hypothetical protein